MHELTAHHHVALTVTDCEVSAAWYENVFGFIELFREDADDRRARVLGFAGGGYSVALVEHAGEGSQSFDPRRTGLDHLAFRVSSRTDLDSWVRHLTGQGVRHSGVTDIGPGAILNLADPDGIALALFWDLPSTRPNA